MVDEIHDLPNSGGEFKSDDRIAVDVETSAGSGVWVTKYINGDDLRALSGRVVKTTILSAALLTSGATPVTLLPGVAGQRIVPDWVSHDYLHGGTDYLTNLDGEIKHSTASEPLWEKTGIISGAGGNTGFFARNETGTDIMGTANELVYRAAGGVNPTAGNGDLVLYLKYSLVTA